MFTLPVTYENDPGGHKPLPGYTYKANTFLGGRLNGLSTVWNTTNGTTFTPTSSTFISSSYGANLLITDGSGNLYISCVDDQGGLGTSSIYKSTDNGATWGSSIYTNVNQFDSFFYCGGNIYASSSFQLRYSTNGSTWTTTTGFATNIIIWAMVYTGTAWIAVGNAGFGSGAAVAYRSTDGHAFSAQTITGGSSKQIFAMGSDGSGTLVFCGRSGMIYSSTDDGQTWTLRTPGGSSTNTFTGVAFGASTFVLNGNSSGSGEVQTSSNGVTWTKTTVSAMSGYNSAGLVAWTGSKFIMSLIHVVNDGFYIGTSSNGTTWTISALSGSTQFNNNQSKANSIYDPINGIAYMYCSTQGSGSPIVAEIFKTANSGTTNVLTGGFPIINRPNSIVGIASNGSRLVATMDCGLLYYSDDNGVTWTFINATEIYRQIAGFQGVSLGVIIYSRYYSKYFLTDYLGAIWFSTNGTTWTYAGIQYNGADNATVLLAGPNYVYAFVDDGTLEYSTTGNASAWSTAIVDTSVFHDVCYGVIGNGKVILCSATTGKIYTASSTTAPTSWTTAYTDASNEYEGIMYDGKTFYVYGSNGIVTSPDGVTWTNVSSLDIGTDQGLTVSLSKYSELGNVAEFVYGCKGRFPNYKLGQSINGLTWSDLTISGMTPSVTSHFSCAYSIPVTYTIEDFEGIFGNVPIKQSWSLIAGTETTTQSTSHVTQGTFSFRTQVTTSGGIILNDFEDFSNYTSIFVDVFVATVPSGGWISLGLTDATNTYTVHTTASATGTSTLELKLPNAVAASVGVSSSKLEIMTNAAVSGTYDFYVDNLRALTDTNNYI